MSVAAADQFVRRGRRSAALLAVAAMTLGGVACSEDDADSVADAARDVAGTVADAAQDASARTVAEAFRAALLADDGPDGANRRRVTVLQEAAGDLPGNPDVRGVEDGDGDGFDDDGRVEIRVGDQSSCVLIDEGGDTNIENC